jgi:hypothetical protein
MYTNFPLSITGVTLVHPGVVWLCTSLQARLDRLDRQQL